MAPKPTALPKKPDPKIKAKPTLNQRMAASTWMDIFQDVLPHLVEHRQGASNVVRDAVDIANAALDAYEYRWPEVPLL